MKKGYKVIITLTVLTAGFILFRFTSVWSIVSRVEELQNWIGSLGVWGYMVYVGLYVLCAVFLVPGSILTIAAGIIYGPITGGIMAIFSATLAASVAFLIARYVARDLIESMVKNNPVMKRIDQKVGEHGTSFLILTRLLPIFPFNVQNYAYGITGISFPVYVVVSFITMLPGSFIYAYMAGEIIVDGISVSFLLKFVIAGILLFLLSLIPRWLAKKKNIDIDSE